MAALSTAPGLAQERPQPNPQKPATERPVKPAPQDATAAHGDQANFGRLISALNNQPAEVKELEALATIPAQNIHIVDVSSLMQGNNATALHGAMDRNKPSMAGLSGVLSKNAPIAAALKAQNIDVKRVVAVDVTPNSMVTLYVHPPTTP